MQQYFVAPSGNGEPIASKYGDGLRPLDFLPREFSHAERAFRVQLFVEQRRHHAKHFPNRERFLHGNRFCQRVQQYFRGTGRDGEPIAFKYGDGFRPVDFLPGKFSHVERTRGLQLLVEQRCHHAEHFPNRERFLFGNRFCQRMQQHFRVTSGDGESVASKYGDGLRPVDFLPGKFSHAQRTRRLQLFVEQRRHLAEHFSNRERFVFRDGQCQRLQQYFCGTNGCGESVAV
jgi:hypothetical protein